MPQHIIPHLQPINFHLSWKERVEEELEEEEEEEDDSKEEMEKKRMRQWR